MALILILVTVVLSKSTYPVIPSMDVHQYTVPLRILP